MQSPAQPGQPAWPQMEVVSLLRLLCASRAGSESPAELSAHPLTSQWCNVACQPAETLPRAGRLPSVVMALTRYWRTLVCRQSQHDSAQFVLLASQPIHCSRLSTKAAVVTGAMQQHCADAPQAQADIRQTSIVHDTHLSWQGFYTCPCTHLGLSGGQAVLSAGSFLPSDAQAALNADLLGMQSHPVYSPSPGSLCRQSSAQIPSWRRRRRFTLSTSPTISPTRRTRLRASCLGLRDASLAWSGLTSTGSSSALQRTALCGGGMWR